MKFAKFILAAALILPFFATAQESLPPDLSAPPAPPSMNEPGLDPLPSEGAITQPPPAPTPAAELGETKKPNKKKAKKKSKKEKKAHSKKGKKHSKKAKKGKKKKHHAAY